MKQILLSLIFTLLLCFNAQAKELVLIRDDEVESIIKEITKPIFKTAGLAPESISIYLIAQDDPNAFVMGGQNIFISTGLLKFSDNPDVLAGVLAHETGHIIGGHLVQHSLEMKHMQSKMLLNLLAAAAVGAATKSSDAAIGTMVGGETLAMGSLMSFSRAQESAADSTSARIMNKLGIGNSPLISFLHSLGTTERTFYGDIPSYYRTHPLSKHRIEFLKASVPDSYENSYINNSMRDRFKMAHAKIVGFTSNSREILNEYRNKDSKEARYARSILYFREHNKKLAIAELDKVMEEVPNSPYLFELKGQILFELGQTREAIHYYQNANSLKPSSDIIAMEYASALIANNSNPNLVLKLLTQVLSHHRDEALAWNLLGKTYKQLDNEAEMHIAFAFEAYLKDDLEIARKQINAAKNSKDLAEPSKAKLKDIEQLVKNAASEKVDD
jgi:predicted Zn-dependent protease